MTNPSSAAAPPHDELRDEPLDARKYRLYSISSIGGAAMFGSPVAAAWLLSQNYIRLGNRRAAALTWVASVAALAAIMAAPMVLPDGVPDFAVLIGVAGGYQAVASQLLKMRIDSHIEAGGKLEPFWKALAICLAGMIPWIAIGFLSTTTAPESAASFAPSEVVQPGIETRLSNQPLGVAPIALGSDVATRSDSFQGATASRAVSEPSYRHSDKELVFHSDGSTQGDARQVARVLAAEGWFTGVGASDALVRGTGERRVVVLLMADEAIADSSLERELQNLRSALEWGVPFIDGVSIQLATDPWIPLRTIGPGN